MLTLFTASSFKLQKEASDQSGSGLQQETSLTSLPSEESSEPNYNRTLIGGGLTKKQKSLHLEPQHLKQIAHLVKKEIFSIKPVPTITTWRNYDRAEPTVTSVGYPQVIPLNYAVEIEKSNLNDKYDEKKLLSKVPREHIRNALELLKAFEDQPNEISFDSQGTIFINEESIPESNIYKFFPLLFRKRKPKSFTGYQDFVEKLLDMGLGHYIKYPINDKKAAKMDTLLKQELNLDTSKTQWWYLG